MNQISPQIVHPAPMQAGLDDSDSGLERRSSPCRTRAALALSSCLLVMLSSCAGSTGGQAAPPQNSGTPSITLIGANPQLIAIGGAYQELGAIAIDDEDGDLSAGIVIDASAVSTSVPGSYLVTYNVSDADGNAAPARIRTVTITDPSSLTFVVANNGMDGFELYLTDGSAQGTVMVKDINPNGDSKPEGFVLINDTLFFSASDGAASGREIWKSDGTEAGTVMLKDISPGSASSNPWALTRVGDTLFFRATDIHGTELWKSDGTAAGTVLVRDIDPANGYSSAPSELTDMDGTLFFGARVANTTGHELWRSDGTEAGTVIVKNIRLGTGNSTPSFLVKFNGALYFSAASHLNGTELWKSDGTEAGTVMVKDIRPGSGSYPSELTVVGDTLFFAATDDINGIELWKSDGTEAGTVLVKNINLAGDSRPSELTDVNGTLFFQAEESNMVSTELWMSDGTLAGTRMVKEISPGGGSRPQSLVNMGGTVLFRANDGSNGRELWKSDGTEAGTVMVLDINPTSGSDADPITSFNNFMPIMLPDGRLLFGAMDGTHGREAWITDGTAAGTTLMNDMSPGTDHGFYRISH